MVWFRAMESPEGVRGRTFYPRTVVVAVMLILLAAAAAALWQSSSTPAPTAAERTSAVAAGIRCPVCAGESVAASQSDLAQQMRSVIDQQLRAGRSPDQVRAWFAMRYGDGILLDPPPRGAGWFLVLAPAVVLAGVVALLAGGRPARRLVWAAGAGGACAAIAVLSAGHLPAGDAWHPNVAAPATSATTWSAPTAGQLDPLARSALEALVAGEAPRAERLARAALGSAGHDERRAEDALLVLGLAQREQGDPRSRASLSQFLDEAPGHPLAGRVRELLSRKD